MKYMLLKLVGSSLFKSLVFSHQRAGSPVYLLLTVMEFHHRIPRIGIVGVLNTTTLPKHFESKFRFSLKVSVTLRAAKPVTFVRQRNV